MSWGNVEDRVHVFGRMGGSELFTRRKWCLHGLERTHQPRLTKRVVDRLQPRRALRMVRPHFVFETIRVRNECGSHLIFRVCENA